VLQTLSWWLQNAAGDVDDFHAALSDATMLLNEMITHYHVQQCLHNADEDVDDISHKKDELSVI
jgi:hypothetical protein